MSNLPLLLLIGAVLFSTKVQVKLIQNLWIVGAASLKVQSHQFLIKNIAPEHENWNMRLSYEVLQSLDDFEWANVVIFGNRTFHPLQHQACKAAVAKRDCFILMPTGCGKSLCYQLPATLQPGVTVVVSPLLSLIQDQIITLNLKYRIPATFLNSQQTASQAAAVLQ
nr:ATP-dependent DNA helicase Q-like 1 [Quercus suber]